MPKSVTLLRAGNDIVVDPTTPKIRALLTRELTYIETKVHCGPERRKRLNMGLSAVEELPWECYDFDYRGRLATAFGFTGRIVRTLKAKGYEVRLQYANAEVAAEALQRSQTVYQPRWDRIEAHVKAGFEFRHGQRECLEAIAKYECGRIDCPPGWGKGTVIMLGCMLYPKATIAVVTDRCPVLLQRLRPELALNLPSVGIVGCGHRITGRRVMCYSADSLHHASGEEDILFVDEGHEACADEYAYRLARFAHARIWMFSASWDMRRDGKDVRAEALAGPVRYKVTYQEAEGHDMVVPIKVIWTDVIFDENPASGLADVNKKRAAYWANNERNNIIARVAREYDDDTQVLITVDTVEHALNLKKRLPEFRCVYAGQGLKPRQLRRFRKLGLLDGTGVRASSPDRIARLAKRFGAGKIRKVIVTTVWNVGVDFSDLAVLIRADGGASPIADTQIPGRTSRKGKRKLADGTVKVVGIVRDFLDQFDRGCAQRAQGRKRNYEKHGWKQVVPNRQKLTQLKRVMKWGNI